MDDGLQCGCGKFAKFPPYVYARTHVALVYTCECGQQYELRNGLSRKIGKKVQHDGSKKKRD